MVNKDNIIRWTRKFNHVSKIIGLLSERFAYKNIIIPIHTSNPLIFRSQLMLDLNRLVCNEHLIQRNQSLRLYSIGAVYSSPKEQQELDVELMNCEDPISLIEILDLSITLFKSLRIHKDLMIHLNVPNKENDEYVDNLVEVIPSFNLGTCMKDPSLENPISFYKDGVIFEIRNGEDVLCHGGQYMINNMWNTNSVVNLNHIIDLLSSKYCYNFDEEDDDHHIGSTHKITIIPKTTNLKEIAYLLANIKRNDRMLGRSVDCDFSDRDLIDKIKDAKVNGGGYYLVESEDKIKYFSSKSNKPRSDKSFQQILDQYY